MNSYSRIYELINPPAITARAALRIVGKASAKMRRIVEMSMRETYKTVELSNLNGTGGGPGSSTTREIQLVELDHLPHRILRSDEIVPPELHEFISTDAITGDRLVPIRLFGR